MPKKILPSDQMKKEIHEMFHRGIMDLSQLILQTSSVFIQKTLEEEREAFLGRHWAERTPDAKGYANGYEPKTISTSEGSMSLKIPQVRGTEEPFRSQTLAVLKNRSDSLELLALQLYIGGLSYADIADVFKKDLGVPNMSETVVVNLCKSLKRNYEEFMKNDLSQIRLLYLFLDGMYLRLNRTAKSKEAVLVARGYTEAGRPVLLGMAVGPRESFNAWRSFLTELRDRGLKAPLLTTCDGCPGMLKALHTVYPESEIQRCLFHMRGTLLSSVSKEHEAEIKARLNDVFEAGSYAEALKLGQRLISDFEGKAQSFVDKFSRHLESCLVFYKFPQMHWIKIRTSNVIERLFQEVKRRTKIIPSFGKQESCLMLCYSVLVELAKKKPWRGIAITDEVTVHLEAIKTHLKKYEKRISDFDYGEAA